MPVLLRSFLRSRMGPQVPVLRCVRSAVRSVGAGRAGFILGYVMIMGIVVGALAFTYYQAFRHRDAQVRRGADTQRARFLARAVLEGLRFALREELLRATPTPTPDIEGGRLGEVLLQDPTGLARLLEKKAPRGRPEGHRDFLEQIVGPKALEPLDRLVKEWPGARATLWIEPAGSTELATPLVPGSGLTDPVMKRVTLRVRCLAQVRHAKETLSLDEHLVVYHELPEVASRFTMFAVDVPAVYASAILTTASGEYVAGPAPVICVNAPSDGDPVATDPLIAGEPSRPLPGVEAGSKVSDLPGTMTGRGLVYLDPVDGPELDLGLSAGGPPLGELYTVFRPQGRTWYPTARGLKEQPEQVVLFRAPSPGEPDIEQQVAVQGGVFGLYRDIDGALLGPPASPGVPPGAGATLRPFGTAAMPSSTLIYGPVRRKMAAISDLAIDRDATGTDEADQRAAGAIDLPEREAIDPFLAHAGEDQYEADLEAERQGRPYRTLRRFGSPDLPPGSVTNQNSMEDTDGDGIPDRPVASELAHQPVRLDLGSYRYANLFKDHADYRRVMSRELVFPANVSLQLASMKAEEASGFLADLAFMPESKDLDEFMFRTVILEHRSSLHKSLERSAGHATYVDGRRGAFEDLALGGIPGTREIVVVEGQQEFMASFMTRGSIDLQGLEVIVVGNPEKNIEAELVFEGPVTVVSGGVLQVPRFAAPSIVNQGQGIRFRPLILRAGELEISSIGPIEASVFAGSIKTTKAGERSVIRGSLAFRSVPGELTRPLVVSWDPRLDPLSEQTAAHYRARIEARIGFYDWEDPR